MSDETVRLKLPQLVSLQELNAVTWNEALAQLDALVDLYLLGQFIDTPPASPADGDAYLTGGAPTGAWSDELYKIAACLDGAWRFYVPYNGLRAFVAASNTVIVYLNGQWIAIGSTDFATKSGAETFAAKTFSGATYFPSGVVDASGKIGIGTVSPAVPLHIQKNGGGSYVDLMVENTDTAAADTNQSRIRLTTAGDASGGVVFGKAVSTSPSFAGNAYFWNTENSAFMFATAGVERLRISRTGGLSFGAASYTGTDPGLGNVIVQGSIGIGTTSAANFKLQVAGNTGPNAANAYNLGSAAYDFANGWIRNAWTVTSDRRLKTNLRTFSEAEIAAAAELIEQLCLYQWQDAVTEKGDAKARLHSGLAAQDALAVMQRHGLDAARYGWFCADPVAEDDTLEPRLRYAIRYTDLHNWLIAALWHKLMAAGEPA